MSNHLNSLSPLTTNYKSRSPLFLFISALLGILGGEALGVYLVAVNNSKLLLEQEIITKLGYLAVPGSFLFQEIKAFPTFLAGGLFFALTIGLGYGCFCGLIVLLLAPLRKKHSTSSSDCNLESPINLPSTRRKKKPWLLSSLAGLIFLICLLLWLKGGQDPMVCLFYFSLPIMIWVLSVFLIQSSRSCHLVDLGRYGLLWIILLLLLGRVCIKAHLIDPQKRSLDFIEIRDRLLLPTRSGQLIDEFYYHYTLYPALIVQPLANRLQNVMALKTENFTNRQATKVKSILERYDWFPLSDDISIDLPADLQQIETTLAMAEDGSGDLLFFQNQAWPLKPLAKVQPVYRISYEEFINKPYDHLKEYSYRVFPFAILQIGCGLSLFFIIPIALSLALLAVIIFLLQSLLHFIIKPRLSKGRETLFLLGFFILLLLIELIGWKKTPKLPDNDLAGLWNRIKSEEKIKEQSEVQLNALHQLNELLTPESAGHYKEEIITLTKSPDPVKRRFGAEFLAYLSPGNEEEALPLLQSLLEDKNINVVYTAARSLENFNSPQVNKILLSLLTSNQPWYLKMKVYSTLQDRGWHQ